MFGLLASHHVKQGDASVTKQFLNLDWQGPLKGAALSEALNTEGPSTLDQWGVYFMLQKFPRLTIGYAGEAKGNIHKRTIRDRWLSHMNYYRSLKYNLHVDDPLKPERVGIKNFREDLDNPTYEYLAKDFRKLDSDRRKFLKTVAENEIEKIELYYCRFPDFQHGGPSDVCLTEGTDSKQAIGSVEAQLIEALFDMEEKNPVFACDNSKSEYDAEDFPVDQEGFKQWVKGVAGLA